MYILVVVIHIIVALFLIAIVLLQTGKGADMGAVFGGSSQTLFGSVGPGTFLSKITAGAAIIFMITSLGLAYLSGDREGASIMKNVKPAPVSIPAPAAPGPAQQPGTPKAPAPLPAQPAVPKAPAPVQPKTK